MRSLVNGKSDSRHFHRYWNSKINCGKNPIFLSCIRKVQLYLSIFIVFNILIVINNKIIASIWIKLDPTVFRKNLLVVLERDSWLPLWNARQWCTVNIVLNSLLIRWNRRTWFAMRCFTYGHFPGVVILRFRLYFLRKTWIFDANKLATSPSLDAISPVI